jgi:tetratricopeptide (TPR) repeat protein
MNNVPQKLTRFFGIGFAFLAFGAAAIIGQDKGNQPVATVEGTICDFENVPVKDSTVMLESSDSERKFLTHSDESGKFHFSSVPFGKYRLSANKLGYLINIAGPFVLGDIELKTIQLHLVRREPATSAGDKSSAVQLSDEPQFQVAGIADPTNYGGHGSDTVLRTKEALAKDTISLNHDASNSLPTGPIKSSSGPTDNAELHRRMGDAAERDGRPLEAVKEYQLAAEMQHSEVNLFAWGAELLLHRAYEPAIEVFSKGQRLFPNSVRMLLGLAIALYDQGATERGEQLMLEACDLDPNYPEPYLFLGRLQEAEKIEPQGWAEKLKRFVNLHSENAMAHYYYAVALGKQKTEAEDSAAIQRELETVVELDPKFGKAYLQLGVLYSERKDFPAAISAFEKAIETVPLPDEAHYRLAQVYRQTGDAEKARREIKLYNQTSQEKKKQVEEQRREIQQFVYTLRAQDKNSTPPDAKPQ